MKQKPKWELRHLGTRTQFYAAKRKQVRAVIAAMRDLQLGCAFLPEKGYFDFRNAQNALAKVAKKLGLRRIK